MRLTLTLALCSACGSSAGTAEDAAIADLAASDLAASDLAVSDLAVSDLAIGASDLAAPDQGGPSGKRVFLIVLENANWSQWKNSSSAPYLNGTLLPMASHAENYFNPPGIHPSLPNYLWLEAGDNFGVTNDGTPIVNHQSTTAHLVTQLENAGHTWKSYAEDIDGIACLLSGSGLFAPRHVPVLYFDDVTGGNSPTAKRCIDHVRPYGELATDLANGTVPDYSFITPNLCDDGQGSGFVPDGSTGCAPPADLIKAADTWLAGAVPAITGSPAFGSSGVLFITWDEATSGDGPIGLIAVGASVKGAGYAGTVHYDHSSTLRTIERIFALPALNNAASATDLADLFKTFP